RARFPRDKPCGEFLTPATRPLFEDLDVWSRLQSHGLTDIPIVRLVAPSGKVADYRPSDRMPAGFAVRRIALDQILQNAARDAGVEVREATAVKSLLFEREAVQGVSVAGVDRERQEIRARLVIGADGTHSLVARSLGLVRPLKRLQRVAIVSHWS